MWQFGASGAEDLREVRGWCGRVVRQSVVGTMSRCAIYTGRSVIV